MANIKFTNFARTALAVGVGSGDVTMSVTGGTGALFPALTAGQYFYAVLENAALDREIVKVTARATDTFTVTRAQDNTTARAWVAGDIVSLRFVAAAISDAVVGTLLAANNLSDVGSAATARANLGALTAGDNIGSATAATQTVGTANTTVATTAFVDALRSLLTSSTSGTAVLGDRGGSLHLSAGLTVPASVFAARDVFTMYNNTAGALTITQGAGLTLRKAGTATTGNLTLNQRGIATVYFVSAAEAVVSGSLA